jgi:hypothetical protein
MTEIEQMAEMWQSGLSMGQIASHFAVSRGRVSGLISRNRELFARRNRSATQTSNERRSAFHAVKVAEEAKAAPVEPVEPEIDGKEYDAARLPMAKELLDLEPCHCRWPLTDIGPHLFCCAEVVTGSPYCAHHKARSKGRGTISEQRAIKDARWAA